MVDKVYECESCGAAVANKEKHTRWHAGLDTILISYVKTQVDTTLVDQMFDDTDPEDM